MLRRAHERVAELGLGNVETLAVMDAERMALPDRSFDVVVAQFVITAVPKPEATLNEFVRVIRPGGEIVLVNHIGAEDGPQVSGRTSTRRATADRRTAYAAKVRKAEKAATA